MSRPQKITLSTIIAKDQSVASGTSLLLTSLAGVEQAGGKKVTLSSAQNISAATFTITGTDSGGSSQNENITGPNAATVTSVKDYATVTSITFTPVVAGGVVESSFVQGTGFATEPLSVSYRGKNASFQLGLQVLVEKDNISKLSVEISLDDPGDFTSKALYNSFGTWTQATSELNDFTDTTSDVCFINCRAVRLIANEDKAVQATLTILQD